MPKILLIFLLVINIFCLNGCNLVKPIQVKSTPITKPALNLAVQPLKLQNIEFKMQDNFYMLDELNFQKFSENQLNILYKLREYQIILNSYKNYYENQ